MNYLKHHLLLKVKSMYNNSDSSDGIMNIIEDATCIYTNLPNPNEDESNVVKKKLKVQSPQEKSPCFENSKQANIANRKLFCSIPIHCFVLSIQSGCFKNLMYNSNMKESKTKIFNMKVGEGEGVYMQYLIQSFYDTDIFDEMECYSLVRVLELADRYTCDAIIYQINSLFIKFSGIESCEKVVQRISNVKYGFKIALDTSKKILNECGVFAAKYFCPLENQSLENHKLFQQLSFDLLVSMLRCKQPIAWHENSVLYYIELWLEFDKARQTEDHIESLLKATNYFGIEGDFLIEAITKDHSIFNKWSKYKDWFIHAVGHHCFSQKRPYLSIFNHKFSRNLNDSTKNSYILLMKRQVHDEIKTFENSILFEASENFFVYKGYKLSPVICFTNDSSSDNTYSVYLGLNHYILSLCSQSTESLSLRIQGHFSSAYNANAKRYFAMKPQNRFGFQDNLSFEKFRNMIYIGEIDKKFADSLKEYCLHIKFVLKEDSNKVGSLLLFNNDCTVHITSFSTS